jgi:hypothetical protein
VILAAETLRERLELARLPRGGQVLLSLVVLALAVALVLWLYRREGAAPVTRKLLLAGLRLAALVGIVIVILDPVRVLERIREIEGVTIVLVDESASMSVRDRYPPELGEPLAARIHATPEELGMLTRAQVVRRLLLDDERPVLEALAERNPVRVLGFGRKVLPRVELQRGQIADGELGEPTMDATDLAAALREAMEGGEGRPTAAVVLLTDGRSNTGEDPMVAAEALRRRDIPVHAVGIGDPSDPRNTAVVDVRAPRRTLTSEPFSIRVRLRAEGVPGEESRLVVTRRSRGANGGTPIKEYRVRFPAEGHEIAVDLTDSRDEPGKLIYEARLTPLERETTVDDNVAEAQVEVVDEKLRLLLVAGGPGREYRALRALFTRDATVELSCWLQSADPDFPQDGNKRLRRLPDSSSDLNEYDVVILLDPGGEELDESWLTELRDLVRDRGGGLAFVAGGEGTLDLLRSPAGRPIRGLLPVRTDIARAESTSMLGGPSRGQAWGLTVTREGRGHTLTQLVEDPEQVTSTWAALPGFYGGFPVEREKAGAVALVRSADPTAVGRYGSTILLAAQWYGSGRTMFLGTGETWRWRGRADTHFTRFWLGAVRFLSAGRLDAGRGRLRLETDREQYSVGDRIEVRARVLNERYEAASEAAVTLLVRGPERDEEAELAAETSRPGWYRGYVSARDPGWLKLSLPARSGGQASVRLRIARSSRELGVVQRDGGLLGALAKRTGGEFLDPGDIDEAVERIGVRRERVVIPASTERLWDRWWTLFVVVGLLAAEWGLRKRSGMA